MVLVSRHDARENLERETHRTLTNTVNLSFLTSVLLFFSFLPHDSGADINVTLTGEAGDPVVSVQVQGSGSWALSQNRNAFGGVGGGIGVEVLWSGDFFTSPHSVQGFTLAAPLLSGEIVLNTGGSSYAVERILVQDDNSPTDNRTGIDDFIFVFPTNVPIVAGQSYSIAGEATFNLQHILSSASATFSDLAVGRLCHAVSEVGFAPTPIVLEILSGAIRNLPDLTITREGDAVKVSWPDPDDRWILQESSDLSRFNDSANQILRDGARSFILVADLRGSRFLRLRSGALCSE